MSALMGIIVRFAVWEFSRTKIWAELVRDLVIFSGSYILVTIVAFLVNLLRAPALLDLDCQKEISRLSEQLVLPDQAQADHLRSLLAKLEENGKAILRLALFHDELNYRIFEGTGISRETMKAGVRQCIDVGLLHWQNNARDPTSPLRAAFDIYFISPELRTPLKRLLYEEPNKDKG